ncbi:hypothetical protein POTOM_040616 [Populus tomentosa]|uniref:Uncharacterized protein n=1 Tax=Populus tomentosa TaxID=118781 RepID=A0A8X7YUE6_POPTO|nr:hypothetical protein POTOM_040616 [Populus tomentosa]
MILEKKVKRDVDKEFIIRCEGAHICYSSTATTTTTMERERGSPAHFNLFFSLFFFFSYSGRWNLSIPISFLGLLVLFMRIEGFCLLIDMGLLIGSFGCVNSYSKKQCRALFWWLKAAVKKAVKKNGGKKRFKFQYDPSSYALNFDDGRCNLDAFKHGNTKTNTNILQEGHLILWASELRFLSSLALEYVVGILGDVNKTAFSKFGHSLEITCTNLVAFWIICHNPQLQREQAMFGIEEKEQQTNCKKVASNK